MSSLSDTIQRLVRPQPAAIRLAILEALCTEADTARELQAWVKPANGAAGDAHFFANIYQAVDGLGVFAKLQDGSLLTMTNLPSASLRSMHTASLFVSTTSLVATAALAAQLRGVQRQLDQLAISIEENSFLAYVQTLDYCAAAMQNRDRLEMNLAELPLRHGLAQAMGYTCRSLESLPKFPHNTVSRWLGNVSGKERLAQLMLCQAETQVSSILIGIKLLGTLRRNGKKPREALQSLRTLPIERLIYALRSKEVGSRLPAWPNVAGHLEALIEPCASPKTIDRLAAPVVLQFHQNEVKAAIARTRAS